MIKKIFARVLLKIGNGLGLSYITGYCDFNNFPTAYWLDYKELLLYRQASILNAFIIAEHLEQITAFYDVG